MKLYKYSLAILFMKSVLKITLIALRFIHSDALQINYWYTQICYYTWY